MHRPRCLRALIVCALALVGLAVLGEGPTARAAAAVITFEDLGVPPGGRVVVNTQYAAQGVTFNDVSALDYSQPPFPPGFAHSGTVGIEQCFAVEFCTSPLTASFTAGQRRVKVWVGASFALAQPLHVQMTAFDAGHVALDTAQATLSPGGAVTPIATPLEVEAGGPQIRSVEISVPDGFTNGIAIDDVEFTAAGPPPPCNAQRVPEVHLTQPAGGLVVQNNEFLLEGTVATGGAPIESASITAFGQGTRTGTLYPALIGAGGGAFGPVRYSGLLFPGNNKVVVTATNCLGTGSSDEVVVAFAPIPAGASFRLLGLEVTQGVQTPSNTVPLVAATATSFKRTFVRVYLGLTGAPRITSVSGTLTATRPDGSRPGGPLSVPSLNSITVESSGTLASARRSLDTSLNFELPREWLGVGALHLQLEHLEIEGEQTALPCVDCDNPGPSGPGFPSGPALVRFHAVPPLRIVLVGVPYMMGPTTLVSPRQLDFDMLASWLRRAYPSADVQVSQQSLAPLARPPASCDDVNAALDQLRAMSQGVDSRTRFYGLIPDDSGRHFVRGCANIGGRTGSGPAGASGFSWDMDGAYTDWYGGHEIGHMYGRLHPGMCGETHDDSNYPYLGGLIGTAVFDVQGLDAGDAALGLPLALDDWRDGWSDVMTYCNREWLSDYTYRGILAALCAEDLANCPDAALLSGRAHRGSPRAPARSARAAVSITGTLQLASDRVTLDPLWVRPGLRVTPDVPGGAYAIELRGAGGKVLARHPFQPYEVSDAPSPSKAIASIQAVVPYPAATRSVAITHGDRTLASVAVSAHPPKVHLAAPNGRVRGQRVTVRWTARDADGGPLWYTVLYRVDGRAITVATALRRTSLHVDLRGLPGGSHARFEVLASDGIRTASDRSDRAFAVPVKPPHVFILSPGAGEQLLEGRPITFVGAASDLQDGQLAGARLVWSSSLQGELGSGSSVTTTLRPGTHTITLAATNRAGTTATATVTVTVKPVVPVVEAVLSP